MIARIADGLEKRVAPDDAPVQVAPAPVRRATHLWVLVRPLAEPIVTVLFVLVLCVFMLGQRDDLRNRLIQLVGTGNVTAITRALDEGTRRINRYLRDQTLINAIFGGLVALGLYLLGIPYFVLWGVVAALARFVPYLGAIASMLLPAALAFALFPGWSRTLLTVGLFVGMDLVTAYAIEPVLIGYRTGVSSIALLLSAFFWAWIWGPVGLALAIPITVSLAVLGRHVPGLHFLGVLLGDAPVIGTELRFYQRLLARDEDGAAEIARERMAEVGPAGAMDETIIPALALAARDRGRKEISDDDHAFVVMGAQDVVTHLRPGGIATPGARTRRVLGVGGAPGRRRGPPLDARGRGRTGGRRCRDPARDERRGGGGRLPGRAPGRGRLHRLVPSGRGPARETPLPGGEGPLPRARHHGLPARGAGGRSCARLRAPPGSGRGGRGGNAGPGHRGTVAAPATPVAEAGTGYPVWTDPAEGRRLAKRRGAANQGGATGHPPSAAGPCVLWLSSVRGVSAPRLLAAPRRGQGPGFPVPDRRRPPSPP